MSEPTTEMMKYAIAKFMGYEKVTVGYSGSEEETEWQRNHEEWMIKVGIQLVGDYIVDVPNNVWYSWEDVKYHTSWDWLMEAWRKLRSSIWERFNEYPSDFCSISDAWEQYCFIVDIVGAHDVLYKAIQWYNQQKQNNGNENL